MQRTALKAKPQYKAQIPSHHQKKRQKTKPNTTKRKKSTLVQSRIPTTGSHDSTSRASPSLPICSARVDTQSFTPLHKPQRLMTTSARKTIQYFPTREDHSISGEYFGTVVQDPYRWLEDDRAEETVDWVKKQNNLTDNFLDQISARKVLAKKMITAWNYERQSAPFTEGDYIYWHHNSGTQNQSVCYRKRKDDVGEESKEVFIDPNTFSEKGTSSMASLSFTKDGSFASYFVSHAGSDVNIAHVMSTVDKKNLDELKDVKFSGNDFYKNKGLFYSRYDFDKSKSVLTAMTDSHRLYYHTIGTQQEHDKPIFGHLPGQKRRYIFGSVSDDHKWLIVSGADATSGNELYFKKVTDQNADGDADMVCLQDDSHHDWGIVDIYDDKAYIDTNWEAPNGQVLCVDLKKFAQLSEQHEKTTGKKITNFTQIPECYTTIIKHDPNRVYEVSRAGKYLVVNYKKDIFFSAPKLYSMSGEFVRDVELPVDGTASGFSAKRKETATYYSSSSYISPTTIYKYDLDGDKSTIHFQPKIDIPNFDPKSCVSKSTFYKSKDGTDVPITVAYDPSKVDLESGKNPLMLYGYGGFNVSLYPTFSIPTAVWIALGGIYAVPNIRGGGELGEPWHKAGTQFNKQRVFDDFISAGEWLISQKYTTKDYLAIRGGSNGGLLVGACMTQRPDLFKAAVPMVGVLDMLRYHLSTAGKGWSQDYLTAEDSKEAFDYLFKYSPIHNVKPDIEYPATMVTCADHDDRVVPANSYKFIANLQKHSKNAQDPEKYENQPVLIRIDIDAGHGAGKSITQTAQEHADIQAFCLAAMGKGDIPE